MNTLKGRQQAAHTNIRKAKVIRRLLLEHTKQFTPSGTDSLLYENGRTLATGKLMMSTGTGTGVPLEQTSYVRTGVQWKLYCDTYRDSCNGDA